MPFGYKMGNYMNKNYFTLAVIAIIFLSSCTAHDDQKPKVANTGNVAVSEPAGTPQAVSTQPKDGLYPSKGKVTKINNELGSVELNHEEIVGVMPPMIMEFYVKDKSLLDGLKVGDNVDFVLEYKHPSETIVEIKKRK